MNTVVSHHDVFIPNTVLSQENPSLCKLEDESKPATTSSSSSLHTSADYKNAFSQINNTAEPLVEVEPLDTGSPSIHNAPSSSVLSILSPSSEAYVPAITSVLYPPGEDKFGRTIITTDSAEMLLDYFDNSPEVVDSPFSPAEADITNTKGLRHLTVKLPDGQDFLDRILPPSTCIITSNPEFPVSYFLNLHNEVKAAGTYNYAGARIRLQHCRIDITKFRSLLGDYNDIGVLQYLEYGFPVGLAQEFELESCTQNHSSALEFYSYIDAFFKKEAMLNGITGPMDSPPFQFTKISPLMTAVKKPSSRRPVFDASYGDLSINNNTPEKEYLGEAYQFTFPTVLDLADVIIRLGPGCLLWKRDLSRWFMQLPVDPCDYDKLGVIWRGMWFLFVSYVWGCRHAGYNGQRVSSAVLKILNGIGAQKFGEAYNSMVYMDDFAGAEIGERAISAFNDLGSLLTELGIIESEKKASPPSTKMVFLGVEFDTVEMCMRVGEEKLCELKSTINKWFRRTVASKEELQSLQGQLMWVSKVVRFSRCFVTRIISEQKSLKSQKQKKKLSHELKKDLLWWKLFLDKFNGVELMIPATVSCNVLGDATLAGAGAWNEELMEFWSRKFPLSLQSPDYPIHLKEFITVIIQVKVWGAEWSGKRVAIHCDNAAVVQSINFLKPKDQEMQRCLREFLYFVTKFKFEPVMVRIPTKDNFLADFISRNYDPADIKKKFADYGVPKMKKIEVNDDMFNFIADW